MAIKFSKIKPGMRLLDIGKKRMGNTTMSHLVLWYVDIISVDEENETAMVAWNSNTPMLWFKGRLERLYTKPTKACLAQQERRSRRG